ncbi:MAG: helix-turn-helix domain-containing protein [Lachnospiraceae bacterium]|nr:helix-turn-helix domain-containing protein [Lachnospiraceae bacterium]
MADWKEKLKDLEETQELTVLGGDGETLFSVPAAELLAYLDEKDSPEKLCRDILQGSVNADSLPMRLEALNMTDETRLLPYLLRLKNSGREGTEALLGQLYAGDLLLRESETTLLLIHKPGKREDPAATAARILSMVNTELMEKVRIAYGKPAEGWSGLRASYLQAQTAMQVMESFHSECLVMSYASLGLGGLMLGLDREVCARYLRECFGESMRSRLDEEELRTVNCFFEHDLSFSETARDLFLHRNTLVYRLEKIQKKTGMDIRHFEDAVRLRMALLAEVYLDA